VDQKLTLLRNGTPLPAEIIASEAQLTGSVRYLFDYVGRMLKLTPGQLDLIRPGFDTLDLAIGDKIEDWNQVFLHVLEELKQKGVELEQREALLLRMRRDGRTLLYRRELGEERLLTTIREDHRGHGFGLEMVDHDRFKHYNDAYGHEIGDLVLSTTGRLFRMHREGDIGVRWGGDEYLRIVRNLVTETQLGLIAGRDAELVDSFANTRRFKIVQRVHDDDSFRRALTSGRAKVGITIPPDYSDNVLRREQASVQVLIDGSDSQVATTAQNAANLLGLNRDISLAIDDGASQ